MKPRVIRMLSVFAIVVFVFTTMILVVSAQDGKYPSPPRLLGGRVDDSPTGAHSKTVWEIDQPEIYLIRLQGAPLAAYRGGLPGLEATNPGVRGERKLDANSPASIAYRDYLLARQAEFIAKAENLLSRKLQIKHHYYAANNGLAVYLSAEEASRVRSLPEVIFIQPNFERQLETDVTPQWIGAPGIWDGSNTGGLGGTKGEGMIIGVIDTGINPSNPSFADNGEDGYNHTNPWGAGNYVGVCDSSNPLYDATFACNDKLIGAWGYSDVNGGDPRDYEGHGSHTASTAAGNYTTAYLDGHTIDAERQISGIAPHANIVAYAACCTGDALSAAIDQAVVDGVDAINYSIGSTSPSDPWGDFDTVGYLNARDAGIFVATSAGNAGPNANTVGSPGDAPWLTTVAASTHNRKTTNAIVDMTGGNTTPPGDIVGVSFTSGYASAEIVYAGNFGDALCLDSFTPGTFNGEIVICDRGQIARVDKGQHVLDGGAGGFILANTEADGDWIVSDDHFLPAVHITYEDGVVLKNWVNDGGSGHLGTIRGTLFETNDEWGDIMTDFSSRGANRALPDIIKPDITAPGEDVLAAVGIGDPDPPEWTFYGGTSMASPHIAGAGALLMALHPDWTPAEIQSALMTTAWQDVLDYDKATPADPFDYGSGRVDLSVAARAGLVLNETTTNYEDANPASGGDPKTLNLPSMGDGACWQTCTWTRTLRSTLDTSMNWTVVPHSTGDLDITVSPSSFTIPAGGTQVVTVEADVSMLDPNMWGFGEVRLMPEDSNIPEAHLPVAAYANSSTDIERFDKNANIKLVQVGETIEYMITLTHKSLGARTYELTDQIPPNSTYVDGSATGGLVYNSGTDTLSWSGELPAGDFVITEEGRTGFISMAELGVPPVDPPNNLDAGCYLVGLDAIWFDQVISDGIWSVNGTLQMGLSSSCAPNTNGQVPSTNSPNNLLAPWWDDLDFTGGGNWYFVGVTWDSAIHTVFSWENVPIKGTSDTASFQIWIEDFTDNIWFSYPQGGLPGGSPSATIGAENSSGNDGATYYYNGTGTIPDGSADLVLGPVPIVKEFTFQVTADNTPSVINEAHMTEGGNTASAYAFSDVFTTNTWLGNTSSWGSASNWSRGATPASTDWVVIPSSPSGGNMPVLGSDVAARNLEIQTGASLDIGAHKLSVEDSLVNNGILKQTISTVPAGSTTEFLHITNTSGAQDKYHGLEIHPTSGAMGSTTVEIHGNAECTVADPSDTVNRCYNISPSNSQSADIRFYYRDSELDGQDPASMQAWHWAGSGWTTAGIVETRDDIYPDYHWVDASGVNAYSPFTLSDKVGGPTVVSLKYFSSSSTNILIGAALISGILALVTIGFVLYRKRKT